MVDVTVWVVTNDAPSTGDAALREILGRALDCDPAGLRFDRTCRLCGHPGHGKPRVECRPDVSFSVSHSGPIAVVALAEGTEVGVDVESMRPRRHLDRLAQRVLTPAEHSAWVALPAADQLPAFLRHWTAREAYLKALGLGIRRSLRDALADASGWTIVPIEGLDDAVGSVAFEGEGRVRIAPGPAIR